MAHSVVRILSLVFYSGYSLLEMPSHAPSTCMTCTTGPSENKAHLLHESSLNFHHSTPHIFNILDLLNINIHITHSSHIAIHSYLKGTVDGRCSCCTWHWSTSVKKVDTVPGLGNRQSHTEECHDMLD